MYNNLQSLYKSVRFVNLMPATFSLKYIYADDTISHIAGKKTGSGWT